MNYRTFISLLIITTIGCTQKPKMGPNTYKVNVEAKGVYNGIRAYLSETNNKNRLAKENTAMVINEHFNFDGNISKPAIMVILVDGVEENLPIVVEEGEINIKLDKDNIRNSVVSGSSNNDKLSIYLDESQVLTDSLNKTRSELHVAFRANNQNEIKALRSNYNSLNTAISTYQYNYIQSNLNNNFSLILFESLMTTRRLNTEQMQALLEELEAISNKNEANELLIEKINNFLNTNQNKAALPVGVTAPNFSGKNPNGKTISLKDIKGKLTIIDFWASWCKPCRRENPNIVKIYNQYHDKGLEIIGVSLDKPGKNEDWVKAIKVDKLPWQQVSNLKYWNDPIAKLYGVRTIPATFILDENGKIIAKNLRGKSLKQKVAQLLD